MGLLVYAVRACQATYAHIYICIYVMYELTSFLLQYMRVAKVALHSAPKPVWVSFQDTDCGSSQDTYDLQMI